MLNRRNLLLGAGASGLMLGGFGSPSASFANGNPMPDELRQAIERQPFAPVLGNPKGDVTLTEFFDYNCPYCKEVPALLQQLIAQDKDLRIVLREWPILHPNSEALSQISLASLKQDKYWQFHHAMMAHKGQANEQIALRIARDIGLDIAKLKRDMQSQDVKDHIYQSLDLGDHLGLSGTPTFIAGNDGRFGAQTLADLQELVKSARQDLGLKP